MHPQDSSSRAEDQFAIDVSAFIVEVIPNTGIKLLRPRAETEPALSRQLDIVHRLELLRRCAGQKPHPSTNTPLQDVPIPGSDPADTRFLQNLAPVGETSRGETVYLILSAVVGSSRWQGGWGLAVVPPHESERFQAYLADAREAIIEELRMGDVYGGRS
jgi:hypothetical protein